MEIFELNMKKSIAIYTNHPIIIKSITEWNFEKMLVYTPTQVRNNHGDLLGIIENPVVKLFLKQEEFSSNYSSGFWLYLIPTYWSENRVPDDGVVIRYHRVSDCIRYIYNLYLVYNCIGRPAIDIQDLFGGTIIKTTNICSNISELNKELVGSYNGTNTMFLCTHSISIDSQERGHIDVFEDSEKIGKILPEGSFLNFSDVEIEGTNKKGYSATVLEYFPKIVE